MKMLVLKTALRQPLRVVVDSKLQMSPEARMFAQPGDTLIATIDGSEQREKASALEALVLRWCFYPLVMAMWISTNYYSN